MNQDDKLKERTILLMRLYWRDEIHKIGTELNIDEIKKFENYWDLDHYKGAYQIARTLDDKKLEELVARNPPKYVSLGGFQGKHYSVDKRGRISFSSSWPTVKENIKKSLDNWGDKAYSVLRALINKKGDSAYFELIDEIGKILGKEYIPSWILPRLEPLKLVFKTGSNKYPRWTIPTEIIPVIQEELKGYQLGFDDEKEFKRTKSKRIAKEQESSLLSIERKLDNLVGNLVDRKREINLICQNRFSTRFFIDNEKAIMSIKRPCSNEEEFDYRIQGLSSIIDNVEVEKTKKALKINDKVSGSINLMEFLLEENGKLSHKNIIKNLRMLKILRNKKFPTHHDDGKFIEAMNNFGQQTFPPDWEVLWENVLEGTTESLKKFRDSLQ
ncbi:MAG: hypothetical protein IIA82_00915 [Thaumarchaeota archaeon]|nr:hypothetical protein [Nitrososphaerota archaeon]